MDRDRPVSDHEGPVLEALVRNPAPALLERALLVLAGLASEQEIQAYQNKIDRVHRYFLDKCKRHQPVAAGRIPLYRHHSIALCLFECLWNSKPRRFGDRYQLTEVIDAQLDPELRRPVGNCIGLTALYSVLGLRIGLDLSVLAASAHVLSQLRIGDRIIDLEHTDPDGFDCRVGAEFVEFPVSLLSAHVLNSRGLSREKEGRFAAAGADFCKAILIHPAYANAFNNRGNARGREGDLAGAIADYTEAIRLDSSFCEAYCNRGVARLRSGRFREAQADFNAALAINPDYGDARVVLEYYGEGVLT